MYELVEIQRNKEAVLYRSEDREKVELKRLAHVRSLTPAYFEIRKVKTK